MEAPSWGNRWAGSMPEWRDAIPAQESPMTDHTHDHTHEHIGDHEHEHEHEHEHHHVSHEGHEHLGDDEHMFVHFKEGKDAFMQEHPQSPIPEGKREGFKGLSYYPYNPDLHFHATLDRNVSDE